MPILCDACEASPLRSFHNCYDCDDYDLCESCYIIRLRLHDPSHKFMRITPSISDGEIVGCDCGISSVEGYLLGLYPNGNMLVYNRNTGVIEDHLHKPEENSCYTFLNNHGTIQLLAENKVVWEKTAKDDGTLIDLKYDALIVSSDGKILWRSESIRAEQTNKLLEHPGFRLIYVDDSGFTPITMFSWDEFVKEDIIREDVLEKGFRCISHYWGPSPPVWEDHPVEDVAWKVHLREEKRERLLQILNYHKGYFWMDVFCTNQEDDNKPLDIMGKIYKNCIECICMLDTKCDVPNFTSERDLLKNIAKDVKKCLEVGGAGLTWRYGNEGSMSASCRNSFKFAGAYKTYLNSISNCNWSRRVWTWQEVALPPEVLFCSEQAGSYEYNPFGPGFLKKLFPYGFLEASWIDPMDDSFDSVGVIRLGRYPVLLKFLRSIMRLCEKDLNIWNNIKVAARSSRRCTNPEDLVYGITGILNVTIPMNLTLDKAIIELERELQKQGIFIGYGCGYDVVDHLNSDALWRLYENRRPVDGITVLGKINDTTAIGRFNTDVNVLNRKSYGEIVRRGYRCWRNRPHKRIYYQYETETSTVFLRTSILNVGDALETTYIGREGCTFERCGEDMGNEIFEIVGTRVKTIGHIARGRKRITHTPNTKYYPF